MSRAAGHDTFALVTEMMFERPVLVGIDGTPSGCEALSLAVALAVIADAPLLLGAVYGFESSTSRFGSSAWPPRERAVRWLEDAARLLDGTIPWRSVTVEAATVSQGINRLAEDEAAGLLVLGSSRRGRIGRVLAGSWPTQIVHGAPCPVAVVPHGWSLRAPEQPLAVGAGLTDAPEAYEALVCAERLARAAAARLAVLTAVPLLDPRHALFTRYGADYRQWVRERRDRAERLACEAAVSMPTAEIEVLDGDPVGCLTAASEDLDLLVVGSRRYGPIRGAVLGSVSAPLMRYARCPVLVVPRGVHGSAWPGSGSVSRGHGRTSAPAVA